MLVIGHRRFLPSLEKNQFSVCLLFSRFKFFSVIINPFFVLQILFWNLKPSRDEMAASNPAFSTTVSPTSLPSNSCHHPFCYTCSTSFSRVMSVFYYYSIYCVCDKGNTFPFYSGAFSPISWGYFYLHMSRGRSLFVNFKKSLTRTFAVFIIIGLPYDFDFSSIL